MSLFSEKQTLQLDVAGMHCEKCVARVTEALGGVDGVTEASVSLEAASAVVEGRGIEAGALVDAVRAVGFESRLR